MPKFILKRAYLGKDGLKKWESHDERFDTYADALNAILRLEKERAGQRDPDHMGYEVRHGGKPAEGRFDVHYDKTTRTFRNV